MDFTLRFHHHAQYFAMPSLSTKIAGLGYQLIISNTQGANLAFDFRRLKPHTTSESVQTYVESWVGWFTY